MQFRFATIFSLVLLVVITISLQSSFASAQLVSFSKSSADHFGPKFKSKTVVIYPIFTQAAYGEKGFYYYYSKHCDLRCLTVLLPSKPFPIYSASGQGFLVLSSLGFDIITDADVDKNPSILKQYKNVIVLHNEYVTQTEFNAITSHTNVVYLYPNALYAEVKVNYGTNTVTLVKGHEYPLSTISNGFDWKLDNSKYEYNTACNNLSFYRVTNGWMLNCYPDIEISSNKGLLNLLLESIRQ